MEFWTVISVCLHCIVGSTWRGYDALGESAAGRIYICCHIRVGRIVLWVLVGCAGYLIWATLILCRDEAGWKSGKQLIVATGISSNLERKIMDGSTGIRRAYPEKEG